MQKSTSLKYEPSSDLKWLLPPSFSTFVERLTRRGTTHSQDLSGRGALRAENVQRTSTQSHASPSILAYEDKPDTL